jgi:cytochrome c553
VRPEFPSLAGQDRAYLETQLRLFADGEAHRGGGPYAQLMREAARALTKADIAALAAWYAGLAAPPPLR